MIGSSPEIVLNEGMAGLSACIYGHLSSQKPKDCQQAERKKRVSNFGILTKWLLDSNASILILACGPALAETARDCQSVGG